MKKIMILGLVLSAIAFAKTETHVKVEIQEIAYAGIGKITNSKNQASRKFEQIYTTPKVITFIKDEDLKQTFHEMQKEDFRDVTFRIKEVKIESRSFKALTCTKTTSLIVGVNQDVDTFIKNTDHDTVKNLDSGFLATSYSIGARLITSTECEVKF